MLGGESCVQKTIVVKLNGSMPDSSFKSNAILLTQFLQETCSQYFAGWYLYTDEPTLHCRTLLHFQFTSIDQGELIDGLGRVVHVKEDEFGNHGVGLEFLNLSGESEEVIEKIVTSRYDS